MALNNGEREYYISEARQLARVAEINAGGQTCRYKTWYGMTFNRAWTVDGAEKLRVGQVVADEVFPVLYSVEVKLDEATRAGYTDLDVGAKRPTAKIPTRGA